MTFISKGNSCGKNLLCLSFFFRGSRKNILFFIHYYITSHDSQHGKDTLSQIGVGRGSSVCARGFAYKFYLSISGVILQVLSRLPSFSTRACNTKLLFICD